MGKIHMESFNKEDILHMAISDEPAARSVGLILNIAAELNSKGELVSIEILNASDFVRDSILESVQAKMLKLPSAETEGRESVLG